MGGKIIWQKRKISFFMVQVEEKNAIARVRLVEGNGKITINGKDIDEFFGLETLKVIVRQPLTVTNTTAKYDVIANVKGGGFTGQAGAIRHGIARALNEANSEYRPALKSNGFLTRDPRMKERKNTVLKKLEKLLNLAKDKKNFYQSQFNLRSFKTSEVFFCRSITFTIKSL